MKTMDQPPGIATEQVILLDEKHQAIGSSRKTEARRRGLLHCAVDETVPELIERIAAGMADADLA